MTQASVGFHCPECLRQGGQTVQRGPVVFDPLVTKGLIALNLVASLAALVGSGSLGGMSNAVLRDWSLFAPFVDVDGETYRIVTSAFLHDGLVHLGFNMVALWVLGSAIERGFGRARYLSLYVVSLLGGGFGVLLLEPNVAAVGASGAVFGLFGAVIVGHTVDTILWDAVLYAVLSFVFSFGLALLPVTVTWIGGVGVFCLELFVAFLQAYVFTFLVVVFLGGSLHPH